MVSVANLQNEKEIIPYLVALLQILHIVFSLYILIGKGNRKWWQVHLTEHLNLSERIIGTNRSWSFRKCDHVQANSFMTSACDLVRCPVSSA